jgi:hypothetical protein
VLLLLYVPVALNCLDWPAVTDAVAGVTAIEARVGVEFPLLHPASSPANTITTHNKSFFMGETPLSNLRFFQN